MYLADLPISNNEIKHFPSQIYQQPRLPLNAVETVARLITTIVRTDYFLFDQADEKNAASLCA